MGSDGKLDRFVEKPRRADSSLASMGIYVFRKQYLLELLHRHNDADFGRHILPKIIGSANAYGYNFQGYWADVGTVQSFYEANLALLAETPALDLYDPEWVIHTTSADRAGAEIGPQARVTDSLVSDGCRVHGTVIHSVLSPGVYVAPGAVVRDSVILNDAYIGPDAVVDRCIVDEDVRIGTGAVIGDGDDNTPNQTAPERLNTGLSIVGMYAQVPDGARIGRNVAIRPRTAIKAFPKNGAVASGSTL
jgi:glucose-1-phosphate adenylyltransferase